MAQQFGNRDWYAQLGISRDCTDVDVKRAFREQARLWHPDKCKAENAAERFCLLRQAYEILGSPRKRRLHNLPLQAAPNQASSRNPCTSMFSSATAHSGPAQQSSSGNIFRAYKTGKPKDVNLPKPQTAPATLPKRPVTDLLDQLAAGMAGTRLSYLKQLVEDCGIIWPMGSPDRERLFEELDRMSRHTVDEKVRQRAWTALHSKDVAAWLQWQGCEFTFSLATENGVSKDILVKRANDILGRPEKPVKQATEAKDVKEAIVKNSKNRRPARSQKHHVDKLRALALRLQEHRVRDNGMDQSILPALAKVEILDAKGVIGIETLSITKLGAELDGEWWRQSCKGPSAQLAARLVAQWKKRCIGFVGPDLRRSTPSSARIYNPGEKRVISLPSMFLQRGAKKCKTWKDGYAKLLAYGLTSLKVLPRLKKGN